MIRSPDFIQKTTPVMMLSIRSRTPIILYFNINQLLLRITGGNSRSLVSEMKARFFSFTICIHYTCRYPFTFFAICVILSV